MTKSLQTAGFSRRVRSRAPPAGTVVRGVYVSVVVGSQGQLVGASSISQMAEAVQSSLGARKPRERQSTFAGYQGRVDATTSSGMAEGVSKRSGQAPTSPAQSAAAPALSNRAHPADLAEPSDTAIAASAA